MNQNENILEMLGAETGKISELQAKLTASGLSIRPFSFSDESPMIQLNEARNEVKLLENLIARVAAPAPVVIPPLAAAPAPATPSAENKASLTDAEMSKLSWTNRVLLAQGNLSVEQARTILAGKPAAKKDAKSLTERCLDQSTELEDRRAGRK
jgi:hypothetical protein